jgi:hypothetical protein
VFKVALLFSFVGYLVVLTSGVLLWRVAESTGTLDNIERWFTQFGWETFELKGGEVFSNARVIGLFLAIGTTGGAVLMATLFNLVSDIVGGVRVTVLEEEVVERTASSARRFVVKRPHTVTGGHTASTPAPAWSVDDDDDPITPPATSPQPTTQQPATQQPATQQPATQQPATQQPAPSTNGDTASKPAAQPATTSVAVTVPATSGDWSVDDDDPL